MRYQFVSLLQIVFAEPSKEAWRFTFIADVSPIWDANSSKSNEICEFKAGGELLAYFCQNRGGITVSPL